MNRIEDRIFTQVLLGVFIGFIMLAIYLMKNTQSLTEPDQPKQLLQQYPLSRLDSAKIKLAKLMVQDTINMKNNSNFTGK